MKLGRNKKKKVKKVGDGRGNEIGGKETEKVEKEVEGYEKGNRKKRK